MTTILDDARLPGAGPSGEPTAPIGPAVPTWSARPVGDAVRGTVLGFFTEPDFYFRTARPDTRPEWEILALLGDTTRVLFADGRPVGLYAWENVGGDHGCHFELTLRLTAATPAPVWRAAFAEVVAALRWQQEVVRLAFPVYEFDHGGMEFARSLGLKDEGVLRNVVHHAGRSHGLVYFSRIWEPRS
jgi:hypothetical protein